LFRLDTRDLEAQLLRARAAQETAEAQLEKLKAQPRPEELPPLKAAVERARAHLADVEDWALSLAKAHEGEAASSSEMMRAHFNVETARAELAAAQANYDLMASGAWAPDIKVSQAAVDQARADIEAIKITIERMTVRSPVDGIILKRNVEPGRFAPTDPVKPAMVIGDMSTINIRAQVDEEELPRLQPGARAGARLRGASTKVLPLKMLRIEPLAEPKVSLTGLNTERVDTRVVEVIFQVESSEGFTLYPGQIVDVYIDAAVVKAGG
jgi:multidrug resistance efflux pump